MLNEHVVFSLYFGHLLLFDDSLSNILQVRCLLLWVATDAGFTDVPNSKVAQRPPPPKPKCLRNIVDTPWTCSTKIMSLHWTVIMALIQMIWHCYNFASLVSKSRHEQKLTYQVAFKKTNTMTTWAWCISGWSASSNCWRKSLSVHGQWIQCTQ